jgi:hypothetical protein
MYNVFIGWHQITCSQLLYCKTNGRWDRWRNWRASWKGRLRRRAPLAERAATEIFLPALANVSILLVEIVSLKIWVSNSDPSGTIGLVFHCLGCIGVFVLYGRSTGCWRQALILLAILVTTYPIFDLYTGYFSYSMA